MEYNSKHQASSEDLSVLAKKSFYQRLFPLWLALFSCIGMTALYAQDKELEIKLDLNAKTTSLPKIFSPSIDLSGRGYHFQATWPQNLAAKEVLGRWQKEIGFKGFYRLYWDIWEIEQLKASDPAKKELIANYETEIKNILDSGGSVIVSLFGIAPGMGRILDKRSPPANLKLWKKMIKQTMRYLSVEKKLPLWYEVWSAPDSDDFFLGTKQDYLNLYRAAAEAAKELKKETKTKIVIGGPAVSWWYQSCGGNNVVSPEESLIYALIRFARARHLPLDFISWHAYSSDPYVEQAVTTYNKSVTRLIRDWLQYFRFNKDTPLVIDEWNFDIGTNLAQELGEKAYIAASYIPARLKQMQEAGIDYQIFFSLEDFHDNKAGVQINRGVFSFNPEADVYQGNAKPLYNVFMMLNALGGKILPINVSDPFVGVLATTGDDDMQLLLWNYIDPFLAENYLSRNIATMPVRIRQELVNLFKSGKLDKLLNEEIALGNSGVTEKLQNLLKKALGLKQQAQANMLISRKVKISLAGLNGDYIVDKYCVDNACSGGCLFTPTQETEVRIDNPYQIEEELSAYSVKLIILKKKPPLSTQSN